MIDDNESMLPSGQAPGADPCTPGATRDPLSAAITAQGRARVSESSHGGDLSAASASVEAPLATDRSTPSHDTGTPNHDTSSRDSGAPSHDTGASSRDSGTPSHDTGTSSRDSGAPAQGTGTPRPGAAGRRTPARTSGRLAPTGRRQGAIMHDVAQLAGVSHQTVSRVINGHPSVRTETRTKVLQAMQALNYRPNAAARTLVTRRSGTLGIIGFETSLFGHGSILYGLEDEARAAGYFVSVVMVRSLEREVILDAIDRLCRQGVEGIAAVAPQQSVFSALIQVPDGLACVGVGGGGEAPVPAARIDNATGAMIATKHLLDLGHRTVHHMAGPADWPAAQDRVLGWRDTLRAAARVAPPIHHLAWSPQAGYDYGQRLARDPSVTAVFCANDHLALGLLRALHEAGRRVPDDVSVVGFDDITESGFFTPPLTTIHQDYTELGRRGLKMLLRQLDQADRDQPPAVVAPWLVERSSTAPPA